MKQRFSVPAAVGAMAFAISCPVVSYGSESADKPIVISPAAAPVPTPAHGADQPARSPRSQTRDFWGEIRFRGLGVSDIVANDQDGYMMTRLVTGARWLPSDRVRGEIELETLSGYAAGDSTDVGTDLTDRPFPVRRDSNHDLTRVIPRKAYLSVLTDIGRINAGAQTFMWGAGMVANDGANDQPFGDPWLGNVVARVGYALRPFDQPSAHTLVRSTTFFAAADYVIRDDNASLYDGDSAFQGVAGIRAQHEDHTAGFMVIGRHQEDRADDYRPDGLRSRSTVAVLDLHGKLSLPIASDQRIALEAEGAAILGESSRPWSDATWNRDADVRQFGGLARLRWDHESARISVQVESGYAAGDNDPRDGTTRTFTMHTDHNVGLVLFDHVLPLLTARGVDRLGDPALAGKAPPSGRFAINPGSVQNAIYLNPVVRWRPLPPLDVRFGWLFAVPAADIIDPYETGVNGGYPTNSGGKVQEDGAYGHEFDARATWDFDLGLATTLRAGAEGGILLPGSGFDGVPNLDGDPVLLGRLLASVLW